MNNKITHRVDKNALIAELDKLYQLWKEERIINQSFLTEADLKEIYGKTHTFFFYQS